MKKYKESELLNAISVLNNVYTDNIVINDFKKSVNDEYKKYETSKFVKATDAYLSTLTQEDVYIRFLKEGEYGYYKGMYGLFKKGTNRLLRRHTDTGFLHLVK